MKVFEGMAKVDDRGQLFLDEPLSLKSQTRVKVILSIDDDEADSDDTPVEEVQGSLKQALQEARAGERIPLEQMWEGIDAE
ncbi:type II toxin-antitoxin system RelN family antitoxin [Sodalinema gerasimenkoae]|uniref:type II toxin-antitoxin system RelN family antitoxin n=1 Tax=Sodalinema gerasimenkoae TaxID=2862348 RepID=UPI0013580B06|nr:hypothetical protein [Sodalinema gerasimenkoae]